MSAIYIPLYVKTALLLTTTLENSEKKIKTFTKLQTPQDCGDWYFLHKFNFEKLHFQPVIINHTNSNSYIILIIKSDNEE